MTLPEIVELCRITGRVFPEDYMEENWMPHNWVIAAVGRAFLDGKAAGMKENNNGEAS